jgi:hypothetical protein
MSLIYCAFLFYIIKKEMSLIRNLSILIQSKSKNRSSEQLRPINSLKFNNHRVDYAMKSLFLLVVILVVKSSATYIGYSNNIPFLENQVFEETERETLQRLQLLEDFDIDSKSNTFSFDTLLYNLRTELILIALFVLLLILEKKVIKYYHYELNKIKSRYNNSLAAVANVLFIVFLILIPIINSSPLTMIPLTGYLLILVLNYFIHEKNQNKVHIEENSGPKNKKNLKKVIKIEGEYTGLLDHDVDTEIKLDEENALDTAHDNNVFGEK